MRIGCINLDTHCVSSVAGVFACLIDADRQTPSNRSNHITVGTQQKWLCYVGVPHTTHQSASTGSIKWEDSQQILEPARDTLGAVVLFRSGTTHFSAGGHQNVLAGLHVDSGVRPQLLASELNFLGNAALARWRLVGNRFRLFGVRLHSWGLPWRVLGNQQRPERSRSYPRACYSKPGKAALLA